MACTETLGCWEPHTCKNCPSLGRPVRTQHRHGVQGIALGNEQPMMGSLGTLLPALQITHHNHILWATRPGLIRRDLQRFWHEASAHLQKCSLSSAPSQETKADNASKASLWAILSRRWADPAACFLLSNCSTPSPSTGCSNGSKTVRAMRWHRCKTTGSQPLQRCHKVSSKVLCSEQSALGMPEPAMPDQDVARLPTE